MSDARVELYCLTDLSGARCVRVGLGRHLKCLNKVQQIFILVIVDWAETGARVLRKS